VSAILKYWLNNGIWSRSKASEAFEVSCAAEELADGMSFFVGAMISKLKWWMAEKSQRYLQRMLTIAGFAMA